MMRHRVEAIAAWLLGLFLFIALPAPFASGYEESDRVGGGRSTHQVLMDRIPAVLEADGSGDLARYLRENIVTLKAGTIHADWSLVDSGNHYMDPFTGAGLPRFRSADELARDYALTAETAWREGDHWQALEYLGRVLHLVQDLTVPHHARLTALDSHAQYEMWVTDHLAAIDGPAAGIYDVPGMNAEAPTDPTPWLLAAGLASYPKFDLVDGPNGLEGNDYGAAARELVPLAVALSAGFAKGFFDALDSGLPTINWSIPAEGRVGVPVEMSCLRCMDDGVITHYVWTISDGRALTGPVIRPVFERGGLYDIVLTVVDVVGTQATASGQIWIRDLADLSASARFDTWGLLVGLVISWVLIAWVATSHRAKWRKLEKEDGPRPAEGPRGDERHHESEGRTRR